MNNLLLVLEMMAELTLYIISDHYFINENKID